MTVDNASNNDTFLFHLEILLRARGISFDRVQRRIRYVMQRIRMILIVYVCDSCFPHIINLACQAIVKSITKIQYMSDEGDSEFLPTVSTARNFREAVTHDPVAHIHALIRVVCLHQTGCCIVLLTSGIVSSLFPAEGIFSYLCSGGPEY